MDVRADRRTGPAWHRMAPAASRNAGRHCYFTRCRRRIGRRVRYFIAPEGKNFAPSQLSFTRYLTLVLALQLATDILTTSVAPTWNRIGKLAAIAAIETALNYFLSRKIMEEKVIDKPASCKTPPDKTRPTTDKIQRLCSQLGTIITLTAAPLPNLSRMRPECLP